MLEADDSDEVVRAYFEQGDLHVVASDGVEVGVVLTIPDGDDLEIKNIALTPEHRRRGIGTAALEVVDDSAKKAVLHG